MKGVIVKDSALSTSLPSILCFLTDLLHFSPFPFAHQCHHLSPHIE